MRLSGRATRALLLAVGVAVVSSAAGGCGSGDGTSTSTAPKPAVASGESRPAALHYRLEPTRTCLVGRGLAVSDVKAVDPQLRALRDLAQRSSLQIVAGGETIGIAFGNGALLAELLQAPGQPYVLELRGDALLVYLPTARAQATSVRSCLRR